MKIWNLQSLLVCPIILWRVSSTEDAWISGWRSWLASLILNWCLAFSHHMRWCVFWYIRDPRIELLRIRCWRRRRWICKNVSRYTMRVPKAWRLGIPRERLSIPPGSRTSGRETSGLFEGGLQHQWWWNCREEGIRCNVRIWLIRASNSTLLFFVVHVESLCRAHAVAMNTKNTNSQSRVKGTCCITNHRYGLPWGVSGYRSKILQARVAIGKRKISFADRVAEQGRGGFLFLITGRVGNSASMIQMTHLFTGLHGAVSLRFLQELFFPLGCEGVHGSTVMFSSCTNFRNTVSRGFQQMRTSRGEFDKSGLSNVHSCHCLFVFTLSGICIVVSSRSYRTCRT